MGNASRKVSPQELPSVSRNNTQRWRTPCLCTNLESISCDTTDEEYSKVTTQIRNSIAMTVSQLMLNFDKANYKVSFPLTEKETYDLYGSWSRVGSKFILAGKLMFSRMFETKPAVKETFEKFRTVGDNDELFASSVLRTHGMVVMSAVDEIMNSLDDQDSTIELMLEQGRSHARFGDLREDVFWAIEEPFLYAVEKTLRTRYTPHLDHLYKKVIKFILTVIVAGFRQETVLQYRRNVSPFTGALVAGTSGSLPIAITAFNYPATNLNNTNRNGSGE